MNDQIKAVEGLIQANEQTKPRSTFLDVAKGALATARDNMKEHVSELSRQVEARRKKLEEDSKKLAELKDQVAEDQAPAPIAKPAGK